MIFKVYFTKKPCPDFVASNWVTYIWRYFSRVLLHFRSSVNAISLLVSASISWTSASNISKETISCDSQDYDYTECPLDKSGKIINAIVDIQHSNGSCEFLNSTAPEDNITKGIYGYSNDVLWVHGGCGAIFLVWYISMLFSTLQENVFSSLNQIFLIMF